MARLYHDTHRDGNAFYATRPLPLPLLTGAGMHLDITPMMRNDDVMRTTLTLDDDLATQLRKIERLSHQSFRSVVNDVIRRGLSLGATPPRTPARFTVVPKATGFRPGVDPLKLNQFVDELERDIFESHHDGKRAS